MVPTTGDYGFNLEEEEMEIGIGIHGEKGIYREKMETVDKIADRLLEELYKYNDNSELILMINGMGGTPLSELYVVTKYVMASLQNKGRTVSKLLVGDYMTALDMQGFSITILDHDEQIVTALEAPGKSVYF